MRGLLLVCLLVSLSGCRAIADRQGLLGAAREARDWMGTLAAAPVESVAQVENSVPAEAAAPTLAAPPAAADEVSVASIEDPRPPARPARIALPVSHGRLPPAEEDGELKAEPARPLDEAAEESPQTGGPLEALRALLLQPPRVGTSPAPPTAHPTPARAAWRRMNAAAAAGESGDSDDPMDAAPSDDSEQEEIPVRVNSQAPPRPRKLSQPPIPLKPSETSASREATGEPSPLPWRKPQS